MGNTVIFELCEPLPRNNAQIVICIGKLALCTVHVQAFKNLRKVPKSVTRRTSLRHQKRTSTVVPNMELPNVLQSQGDVAESSLTQTWWVQNHLERWHKDDKYRKSLSEIGWTEEQIIQYDELASEKPLLFCTREERTRNEKSWVLKLNKGGVQGQ